MRVCWQAEELREEQRRDGFEIGNADGIFESTSRQAAAGASHAT